jgi:predicted Zn finger-like uncharacterized protein
MRAICPTCATAYTIPDDRIGSTGRKVRCAKCGESWRVMLPTEAEAEVEADEIEASLAAIAPSEPVSPPRDDERFAAVAQHFEPAPPREPPHEAIDEPTDEPPPPVAAPRPIAAPSPAPVTAADVQIRVKPRKKRKPIKLPRVPVALTRAVPFFGPLIFVTALLVVSGLLVFRNSIVATAPGLAGFYATLGLDVNLRGLTFGPIETLREIDNGQPVLVVEGTLANPTQKPREVPALRFALRDGDSQELYAWSIDPKATTIAAGDSLRFRTRLVAPPDRASDLQVRFVERRNQQARLP